MDSFRIVADYDVPPFPSRPNALGIACDIGTTTVVLELVGPGGVMARESFLNGQRRYGSDVISRIRAAGLGRAGELRSLICSGLADGIGRLLSSASIDSAALSLSDISAVSIAGNTAMCHFLLGLPSEGLGVAPFTPAMTVYPETDLETLLGSGSPVIATGSKAASCPAKVVPGISAFVGGDIVSGLAALELDDRADRTDRAGPSRASGSSGAELFLDLGTNAEMAVAVDGSFLCASAAAGPAFEGGSISCGMGSVPGAVASVRRDGSRFAFTQIGGDRAGPPSGLCGSGILDFLSCALEAGLVNADGSLAPVCAESGVLLSAGSSVRLTAEDVRELQLAKAAIRAGIDTLLEAAGIPENGIVRVHLAGAFGLYLDERSALTIGLLPRSFTGKIHRAGNTSLAGAVRWLSDPSLESRFSAIRRSSIVLQLADSPSFSRRFMDAMSFT